LRCGFTTGAAASAAGVAAYLRSRRGEIPAVVELCFPDGRRRAIATNWRGGAEFAVVKDGGDDPDVTDKALILAKYLPVSAAALGPHDYLLEIGRAHLILRGGDGVGLCRRPGLDCAENHWAINPGPRKMLAANLARIGFGETPEWGLLTITVPEGGRLAQRTLNPRLGIVGGISILGTSGIVYPYSHKAYVKTIMVLVRALALAGGERLVLTTGGRTLRAAAERLPELDESCFVRIGDFIYDSLRAAQAQGLTQVVIACMPGKLCKYAAAYHNTHAANVDQTLAPLVEAFLAVGGDAATAAKLAACPAVRQALELIPAARLEACLGRLVERALGVLRDWFPTLHLRLLLFDFEGRLLLDRGSS